MFLVIFLNVFTFSPVAANPPLSIYTLLVDDGTLAYAEKVYAFFKQAAGDYIREVVLVERELISRARRNYSLRDISARLREVSNRRDLAQSKASYWLEQVRARR